MSEARCAPWRTAPSRRQPRDGRDRRRGGLRAGARYGAVNLARPSPTENRSWSVAALPAMAVPRRHHPRGDPGATGPVDLNTATAEQLETLDGIGPVLAADIVQWRTDNGRFSSVDDLLDVSGIGEATLAGLPGPGDGGMTRTAGGCCGWRSRPGSGPAPGGRSRGSRRSGRSGGPGRSVGRRQEKQPVRRSHRGCSPSGNDRRRGGQRCPAATGVRRRPHRGTHGAGARPGKNSGNPTGTPPARVVPVAVRTVGHGDTTVALDPPARFFIDAADQTTPLAVGTVIRCHGRMRVRSHGHRAFGTSGRRTRRDRQPGTGRHDRRCPAARRGDSHR